MSEKGAEVPKFRFVGDEPRELIDAAGRRVVVANGDIADLPAFTAPQPSLWEPVKSAAKTKTEES